MQDANRFNEELIHGLVLELHKGMDYVLTEVGKQMVQQKIDILTEVDKRMSDMSLDFKFEMNQMESRLNHRIDDVSTGLGGKIDRIDKELTTFRKDTNGQLHEIRASLLRIDEKLINHEERLLNLERSKT
ncbi:MAG: hypothetical protein K2Y22_17260 [Candidatus Obscuribacterales bacterium]|nr:hypothetical protein [Candidatus Obscuribacterales bacterium]